MFAAYETIECLRITLFWSIFVLNIQTGLEQPTVVCHVSVVTVEFKATFKDVLVRSVVLKALTSVLLPVFPYLPSFFRFLADRTNGRAIATLLRLTSVVVCLSSSSVTLCIVAKRCVLEQKLLWRAYRKSYMRNRLVPK